MKFFFTLSLIGFIFIFNSAKANETEPNNTPAQANVLALNGSENGALSPAGDVDWYKVTTTADGKLNITLNNTGNQDLKVVSLYDTLGTILLNSSRVGNGVGGINTDGLAAGTYYIKINGDNGNETGTYIISNALVSPTQPNDVEPNNNIFQAERLLLNSSTTGHYGYYYNNHRDTADWYKVTTNADGTLYLTMDNTGNGLVLVYMNLYDTTGSPQLNHIQVGNGPGVMQTNGLAAGTYYVQITANGDPNGYGPYTLKDSLVTPSQPNDKEPNNNFTQAQTLLRNSSTTGHIGYYYNNYRDTSDWYKLTIIVKGKVTIKLDNSGNPDLLTLSLYDSSGSKQLYTTSVGNGVGGIQTDSLAAGNYYVQITGNGNANNFGPYTLSDSVSSALPITFLSFNGSLNNGKAILSWSTASEFNNKGFEVEKSTDGHTYSSIGFVNGAGNSTGIKNYNFTDTKVVSGKNYYRLKQVDNDGRITYSQIALIHVLINNVSVSPNPASSFVNIQSASPITNLKCFNALGSLLIHISPNTNNYQMKIDKLPAGQYFLYIQTNDGVIYRKIVKQ